MTSATRKRLKTTLFVCVFRGRLGCRLPRLVALDTFGALTKLMSAANYLLHTSKVALGGAITLKLAKSPMETWQKTRNRSTQSYFLKVQMSSLPPPPPPSLFHSLCVFFHKSVSNTSFPQVCFKYYFTEGGGGGGGFRSVLACVRVFFCLFFACVCVCV